MMSHGTHPGGTKLPLGTQVIGWGDMPSCNGRTGDRRILEGAKVSIPFMPT